MKPKQAESRFNLSEEMMARIIGSASDFIAIIDRGGRIVFLNTQAEVIGGYSLKEMEGHPISVYWKDKGLWEAHLEHVLRTGEPERFETRIFDKSGGEHVLEVTVLPFMETPRSLAFMGRNVTDIRRLETEAIEKTRALEGRTRDLDAFVFSVSHDLRTPVISVLGFANLLFKKYRDQLDEKGIQYLDHLIKEANFMDQCVQDILRASRVGRSGEAKEMIPLGEVIQETLTKLEKAIKEKQAEIHVREDLPSVYYTRSELVQVCVNLVSNALKFAKDDTPPRIDIRALDLGQEYEILVTDNGIGIDPIHHDKIFAIFYRIKEKKAEGTGAGLFILKRIVENHGGRAWVESKEGEGATFHVTIPKLDAEPGP